MVDVSLPPPVKDVWNRCLFAVESLFVGCESSVDRVFTTCGWTLGGLDLWREIAGEPPANA
jgi:hypothetical protein